MTSINQLHYQKFHPRTAAAPVYVTTQVRAAFSHAVQFMASLNRANKAEHGNGWDNATKMVCITLQDYLKGEACIHEVMAMISNPMHMPEMRDIIINDLTSLATFYMRGQLDAKAHASIMANEVLTKASIKSEDASVEDVINELNKLLADILSEPAPARDGMSAGMSFDDFMNAIMGGKSQIVKEATGATEAVAEAPTGKKAKKAAKKAEQAGVAETMFDAVGNGPKGLLDGEYTGDQVESMLQDIVKTLGGKEVNMGGIRGFAVNASDLEGLRAIVKKHSTPASAEGAAK